jgi:hypothetical protein
VYLDRKSIQIVEKMGNMDTIVNKEKLVNEHYYVVYDDCTDKLKKDFGPVLLYKDGVGKFDKDGVLVQEFTSKWHCTSTEPFGNKTITKILNTTFM